MAKPSVPPRSRPPELRDILDFSLTDSTSALWSFHSVLKKLPSENRPNALPTVCLHKQINHCTMIVYTERWWLCSSGTAMTPPFWVNILAESAAFEGVKWWCRFPFWMSAKSHSWGCRAIEAEVRALSLSNVETVLTRRPPHITATRCQEDRLWSRRISVFCEEQS